MYPDPSSSSPPQPSTGVSHYQAPSSLFISRSQVFSHRYTFVTAVPFSLPLLQVYSLSRLHTPYKCTDNSWTCTPTLNVHHLRPTGVFPVLADIPNLPPTRALPLFTGVCSNSLASSTCTSQSPQRYLHRHSRNEPGRRIGPPPHMLYEAQKNQQLSSPGRGLSHSWPAGCCCCLPDGFPLTRPSESPVRIQRVTPLSPSSPGTHYPSVCSFLLSYYYYSFFFSIVSLFFLPPYVSFLVLF